MTVQHLVYNMQYPPKPWFCRGFTHVWDHRNGVFNTGMGLRSWTLSLPTNTGDAQNPEKKDQKGTFTNPKNG